ncbi:hypothetical protein DFH09DRAFT_1069392 [Mycena vulgaris]|nr:hypothetical protein DFH09DRAFT_1069392 [Mycena vulgaris]
MDPYLIDSVGNDLVPIWSLRENTFWCSLNAPPTKIPDRAMQYSAKPPFLLAENTPAKTLRDLSFPDKASWYNPREHWLDWAPTAPVTPVADDPISFVFDTQDVTLVGEHADVYGYESDRGNSPSVVLAGYFLDEEWRATVTTTSERLQTIIQKVVGSSDFYGRGVWGEEEGDVPLESNTNSEYRKYSCQAICE